MRVCFVANPRSGRASWQEAIAARAARVGATWWATERAGDGARLARRAVVEGFDRVVVVGGDGTVREVVQGLGANSPISVAVIPAGTGNDLARTLAVPLDPELAADVALAGPDRPIDLIRAVAADGTVHLGANMAVGGLAGTVGQRVPPERKEQLGALAYLAQALLDLPQLQSHRVRVSVGDVAIEEFDVIGGVVGNGRTCGGGYRAAPGASLEDGRLDLLLVRAVGPLELAALGARLSGGDYRRSEDVLEISAPQLTIRADPPMSFNLDGDPLGDTPVSFEAVPGALRVVVGPDYVPEGEPIPA